MTKSQLICQTGWQRLKRPCGCYHKTLPRLCTGNQPDWDPQTRETFPSLQQQLIRTATVTMAIQMSSPVSFRSHVWDKVFCIVYFPFIKSTHFSSSHFLLQLIENEKQNLPCTNFKKWRQNKRGKRCTDYSRKVPPSPKTHLCSELQQLPKLILVIYTH